MPTPPFPRFRLIIAALTALLVSRHVAAQRDLALTLTAPLDHQVVQRTNRTQGLIPVEGTWTLPKGSPAPTPTAIEARWAPVAGAGSAWSSLPFNPGASGFRGQLSAPAGGWYRVEVRVLAGTQVDASATVPTVGVGEVFVVIGQSNSANYGEVAQHPASVLVTDFDGRSWRIADDPQAGAGGTKGSFVPALGDALVARLGVPVGFVCLGVGSTSVREWLPRHHPFPTSPTRPNNTVAVAGGRFESTGEIFDRLAERLRGLGPGGARAVLWHQGESDWNQAPAHAVSPADYTAMLRTLIAESRAAAGWPIPWMVAQASYHNPADPGSDSFRAAQRAVADGRVTLVGPDTDALPARLREKNGMGVHFGAEGLVAHGKLWDAALAGWLETQLRQP